MKESAIKKNVSKNNNVRWHKTFLKYLTQIIQNASKLTSKEAGTISFDNKVVSRMKFLEIYPLLPLT